MIVRETPSVIKIEKKDLTNETFYALKREITNTCPKSSRNLQLDLPRIVKVMTIDQTEQVTPIKN